MCTAKLAFLTFNVHCASPCGVAVNKKYYTVAYSSRSGQRKYKNWNKRKIFISVLEMSFLKNALLLLRFVQDSIYTGLNNKFSANSKINISLHEYKLAALSDASASHSLKCVFLKWLSDLSAHTGTRMVCDRCRLCPCHPVSFSVAIESQNTFRYP